MKCDRHQRSDVPVRMILMKTGLRTYRDTLDIAILIVHSMENATMTMLSRRERFDGLIYPPSISP